MSARRRGVKFAGAAATAMALVLVVGDGANVGAGDRRPAPTAPPAITVDNPITGASVTDAVYHGTSAPKAVVIGNAAAPGDRSVTVSWISPEGVVLSA
jgi:hypothetical protein